jgi:CheY-like chemotaxis protein
MMSSSPANLENLNGLCVLIVEDSWHVGVGLKHLLESSGASVVGPVPTAADAMRRISESVPDVAVVDINLRGGERSYDLIDQLNERGIRIVVLTGYADVSIASGKAAVILQKPVRAEALIASLLG